MFIHSKAISLGGFVRLSKKYLLCKTQARVKTAGPQRKPPDNRKQ